MVLDCIVYPLLIRFLYFNSGEILFQKNAACRASNSYVSIPDGKGCVQNESKQERISPYSEILYTGELVNLRMSIVEMR